MEPNHNLKMTFIFRLKIDKTAKNEISIVIETLAKLSFTRALLIVISFSVKWRGKLSVSQIKIQTQNERCPVSKPDKWITNPRVQNPDIAIEINPFIV